MHSKQIILQYFLRPQFHAREQKQKPNEGSSFYQIFVNLTDAEVALANNGRRPPQALQRISAI